MMTLEELIAGMDPKELNRMSKRIEKALDGHEPMPQGLVLASAVGAWLASHYVAGDPIASWESRKGIMMWFINMSWQFTSATVSVNHTDIEDSFAGRH